jgi:hypothetical protein
MRGSAFLDLARNLTSGPSEAYWRAAVIHAYYALMLECRDALKRWGRSVPPRQNVHAWVRLQFAYASASDLIAIGGTLDTLVRARNQDSYDLDLLSTTLWAQRGAHSVSAVQDSLRLLAEIEADSSRRTTAIAALPP